MNVVDVGLQNDVGQNVEENKTEHDEVEIVRQVDRGQGGGKQNGDQAEYVRQVAAEPVYHVENPSALVLRAAAEHGVDRLEDEEQVARHPEVLMQRVLGKVNFRSGFFDRTIRHDST